MKTPRVFCLLLPLVATVALTGACARNAFSPPSSTLPVASAPTIGKDRTAVSAGFSSVSGIFGPDIDTGYLEFTHGVTDRTEVSLRATRAEVKDESSVDTDRVAVAGRLGFKHNPEGSRYFAFIGGLGAGRSVGGRFVSADVGFAVSYDNCHLIPTFSARFLHSEPIDPRPIDFGEDEDKTPHIDTPKRTAGFDTGVGLELPIGGCGVKAPFALRANVGVLNLYDGETEEELMQGTIDAVIRF